MTAASRIHFASAEAEVEDLGGGIRRHILSYGGTIMTCRIWFESGAIGAVDRHPNAQTNPVETGRFLYQVADAAWEMQRNDCVYDEPNTDHGITRTEAGSVIDSFSPMRADFLGQGEA